MKTMHKFLAVVISAALAGRLRCSFQHGFQCRLF